MCDPMNRARRVYQYYFIRFEIRRKAIFNAFSQFSFIKRNAKDEGRCDKLDSKEFLKVIFILFQIRHKPFLTLFSRF